MAEENKKYDEFARVLYELWRNRSNKRAPFYNLKPEERDYWRGLALTYEGKVPKDLELKVDDYFPLAWIGLHPYALWRHRLKEPYSPKHR